MHGSPFDCYTYHSRCLGFCYGCQHRQFLRAAVKVREGYATWWERNGREMAADRLSNPEVLVSVVIPCYNPTLFLKEALASVQAQTYEPVEIIIVDDGTDRPESRELLKSVAPLVTHFI